MLYEYCEDDFIFEVDWNGKNVRTAFDKELHSRWTQCVDNGLFRYRLETLDTKRLTGNFQFLAQLNTSRTYNRRAPENIESVNQPFDNTKFNFTKAKIEEHIFRFKQGNEEVKNFLLINVSPIESCHSLLLPELFQCLPQRVTLGSIELSLQILLLSSSPALRVAYNGLCAFASVNHLHYHIYYLQYDMLLEEIEAEHLSGPCYIITKYPAPAFAFQLKNKNVGELARAVDTLTNYLQSRSIPHNMYITRGTAFSSPVPGSVRNCVRIYVWARKPAVGIKDTEAFNPAVCELFGHFVVKTKDKYLQLSEEKAAAVISDACQETFDNIKDQVKNLFAK